jgi:ribose transport system ATP-binding protein
MDELVGEYVDPNTLAMNLSLSVKAWITIGRAFLRENTKVLILDESSAALDFDSTERLFNKMRLMRDNGAAIFIVTHRIAELIRISDKATVLRDGVDVGVLEKKDITEKNLLSLMTGKVETEYREKTSALKTQSEEVIMSAKNLKVWSESDEVNFELIKGQILGVTGLDGHGQDDFVKILAGVQDSYGGEVEIKNNNTFLKFNNLKEAKNSGISFVSGDRKKEGILPNLSIYENMVIPLYRTTSRGGFLGFINWLELNGMYEWELERLKIKTGLKSDLITSLSGGNQQKVMIARSFAQHPKVLILNDPARGIDVNTKRDLYKHLRTYVEEGNSVIFLSSELEEFIGLCSKVLVFRHGSVFDIFEDDKVEPAGLLEGMFGQTEGIKKTNIKKNINSDHSINKNNKLTISNDNQPTSKKYIKVLDFDKDKKEDVFGNLKKIKVKHF